MITEPATNPHKIAGIVGRRGKQKAEQIAHERSERCRADEQQGVAGVMVESHAQNIGNGGQRLTIGLWGKHGA